MLSALATDSRIYHPASYLHHRYQIASAKVDVKINNNPIDIYIFQHNSSYLKDYKLNTTPIVHVRLLDSQLDVSRPRPFTLWD